MQPLPIDPRLPAIAAALAAGPLVLEAPPGAGKTTRVPPALLEVLKGEIVVLEPRRLAARLAARRVAEELGEEVGGIVGYQVRFEDVSGPRTRIRYLTEGLLGRRLLSDPTLAGVGAVLLDEFHERHLQGDLALALLRRLQQTSRPDLRLGVMSATLEAAPVARFLGDAPAITVEGRRFEVTIEHLPHETDRPLDAEVASAVRRLVTEDQDGDVLVFLPGAAEIARARTALGELAERRDLLVVTLHGDLSPAEQDLAVRPATRRKVILSTNVAETSVTIEGVAAVVDSGLARIAGHSPWSGVPTLRLGKISRASATQRAGRAGRTRAGRCLRLYTKHDHDSRPAFDTPEILRADLAEPLLALHGAGVVDVAAFDWFEAPPAAAVSAADALLRRLGAVGADGRMTEVGRRMLRFPVHPRLARVLAEAETRGVGEDAAETVAVLSDGRTADRARRQLARLVKKGKPPADPDAALASALLAGFPDRVAKRRRAGSNELLLATGGTLELHAASKEKTAELMVVLEAEERRSAAVAGARGIAREVHAISAEMLLDVAPEAMRDETEVVWNEAGRVEVVSRLRYDEIILEERRRPPNASEAEAAARVLATAALAAGIRTFVDGEELDRWLGRVAFVATSFPDAGVPVPSDDTLREAVAAACAGATTFAELRDAPILATLRAPHERTVARFAPERVTLAGGRAVKIHYEPDKPPWIASRLQDFFGMSQSPTVGNGRVPLVLHLLAPNQRAVQVTTDLAGFWTRHYPAIRKELMRKYPKHKWPENPV